ncbi:hypothetical protein STEG23_028502, partial [Scotinomys teguina]
KELQGKYLTIVSHVPWDLYCCYAVITVLTVTVIVLSVALSGKKKEKVSIKNNYGACPKGWIGFGSRCFYFSEDMGNWTLSQTSCMAQEAQLARFDNMEELDEEVMAAGGPTRGPLRGLRAPRFIYDFSKRKGQQFFIGLSYVPVEKIWKWINGSILNLDLLRIMGTDEENSCAVISHTEVFSDFCSADNRWICQKKLNRDSNPGS